jgi:hypothetical protein
MTHRLNRAPASGSRRARYRAAAVIGWLVFAVITVGLGSAAAQVQPAGPSRGSVVSYRQVAHMSLRQARRYLHAGGFGSPAARHGVDIYRIVYRTLSPQGQRDTASGVLALPADPQRVLRVVDFEHGTMVAKADAPSVAAGDRREVVLLAGAGYAAVEPDYLGLGLGPGHHPYLDPQSETTASVDMLRAARLVASREHRRLDSTVMVAGFSEGGQAAMALARALQQGAVPHLRLGAVAAISGPYDLQHAQLPAALDGSLNPKFAAFYFGYWVTAMNRFHHLYTDPSQVFRAPYDKTVPRLFNGLHSDLQVLDGLPASPQQLFTHAFLQKLAHPRGEILRLVRADDTTCTSWVPHVPARLYAASGDTQVAYLNSVHCQRALAAHGRHVPLIDVGNVDHFPSEHRALPRALRWFERLQPA